MRSPLRAVLRVVKADSRDGRQAMERLLSRGSLVLDAKVSSRAARIVQDVRRGGDKALLDKVRTLDRIDPGTVAGLALAPPAGDADRSILPGGFQEALERAIAAVERFHVPQVRTGYRVEEDGVELEERVTPLSRIAVYVPGGRASYPSTVVMTVVPARLAGVKEIVVATPPAGYHSTPALRYALERLEVKEVWGMGGAQAVAALAYGTETIRRVDKIVGPGNAWVTAAKRLVAGDVAIDGLAGPSEVVIVADGMDAGVDPDLVAADLLAQAEHDPMAAAVLLTPDPRLARAVSAAVDRQLGDLVIAATAGVARASLDNFGVALVVGSLEEALAPRVSRAGAIFLGASTPEVFGDYIAGPSHVLPTCGSARFASSLGVEDFLRRSHTVRFSAVAAGRRAAAAAILADAEGLPAHAAAARRRLA